MRTCFACTFFGKSSNGLVMVLYSRTTFRCLEAWIVPTSRTYPYLNPLSVNVQCSDPLLKIIKELFASRLPIPWRSVLLFLIDHQYRYIHCFDKGMACALLWPPNLCRLKPSARSQAQPPSHRQFLRSCTYKDKSWSGGDIWTGYSIKFW
jgi:hypothetical protein